MISRLPGLARLWEFGVQALRARFARDVAVVGLGTAAAQAVSVLAAPVLTRIYAPEEFGLFGTVATLSATLGTVACLRYETAVILAEDDEGAAAAAVGSMLVAAASTGAFALVALLALAWSGGGARAAVVLGWSALLVATGGLTFVGNAWASRRKRFSGLALYQMARSVGGLVLQVIFALVGLGAVGLILGQAGGQVAGLLVLILPMIRDLSGRWRRLAAIGSVRRMLRKYRTLAAYSAPQSLVRALSDNLPVLILGATFGAAQTGWVWLAQRILMLPSLLIAESLRPVFFQRASELWRDGGDVLLLFLQATLALTAIDAPVVLILAFAGPDLFALIFGEPWRPAGHYAGILAPALLAQLAAVPSSVMFQVLGRQGAFLAIDVVTLAAASMAMGIGVLAGYAPTAVGLYAAASILGSLYQIAYILRLIRHPSAAAFRPGDAH